jgi:hypothetical protein
MKPDLAPTLVLAARTATNYNAVQRDRDQRRNGGVAMEKTAQTTIRMTEAEREAWEAAARADGRTLSAWIVRRCNGEPTTVPVSAPRRARKSPPKRKAR